MGYQSTPVLGPVSIAFVHVDPPGADDVGALGALDHLPDTHMVDYVNIRLPDRPHQVAVEPLARHVVHELTCVRSVPVVGGLLLLLVWDSAFQYRWRACGLQRRQDMTSPFLEGHLHRLFCRPCIGAFRPQPNIKASIIVVRLVLGGPELDDVLPCASGP